MDILAHETDFSGFTQHTIESLPYFGLEGDLSFSVFVEFEDDQERAIFKKTSRSSTSIGFGICGRTVNGYADKHSTVDMFNLSSQLIVNAWNTFRVFIGVSYMAIYLNEVLVIVITSPKGNNDYVVVLMSRKSKRQ